MWFVDKILEGYMKELDIAFSSGDPEEIKRVNKKIHARLYGVSDNTLDSDFVGSIKGKPVYKNLKKSLVGEGLDSEDNLKMLSSLVTHLVIESSLRGVDIKEYPVKEILEAVRKIVYEGDQGHDIRDFLRKRYSEFLN